MKNNTSNFTLTEKEKEQLLNISRQTLKQFVINEEVLKINEKDIFDNLLTKAGAFVTLNMKKNLRGCIGRFTANDALYRIVQQMTIAAASEDTRFSPVTEGEIKHIDIEISVLTPLQKINNIDEIQVGKHGIYIKKDFRSGTLLPQVAVNNNWTLDEFLGYCSKHKAGLGWDGWKTAEIFTYEAIIFEEE